ncbi:hypothetical protein BDF14DRAFT_1865713 [Spinellus fusiger]|nr:hypothetical protein BDF14DRAFT_1865713 [Spinellus fusiger]
MNMYWVCDGFFCDCLQGLWVGFLGAHVGVSIHNHILSNHILFVFVWGHCVCLCCFNCFCCFNCLDYFCLSIRRDLQWLCVTEFLFFFFCSNSVFLATMVMNRQGYRFILRKRGGRVFF